MTRSFNGRPIDLAVLEGLCAESLRAPTAGNTAGVSMVTVGHGDVARYFEVATDAAWRTSSTRATGLLRAGAVVIVTCSPEKYVARYRESDKQSSALGARDQWPVPYWHTDAAMATMALLLLITEAEWGATIWGNFRNDAAVLSWCGAPATDELFATVLVGYPDGLDQPSSSLSRGVPRRRDRVRRFRRE
jgi:hypothetical protein